MFHSFGSNKIFENDYFNEAMNKVDAKNILEGSNSSGNGAINQVADISEVEIGNFIGTISDIAALG